MPVITENTKTVFNVNEYLEEPLNKRILMAQLAYDYLFKDKPLNIVAGEEDMAYYELLFPDCNVIRGKYPQKDADILGYSELADDYARNFLSVHRYYAALKLLSEIFLSADVELLGADKKLTESICAVSFDSIVPKYYSGTENHTAVIVDDISITGFSRDDIIGMLKKAAGDAIIIFINSRADYCFYDYFQKDLFRFTTPVTLTKKILREEDCYAPLTDETIYVFTKNKEMTQMAEKLIADEKLNASGIEIVLPELTPEQRQIKALEGILAATEERLLYYINKYEKQG